MPTISVKRDHLFELLSHRYSDEEFEQLCFDFGIELDDVTTEREIATKQGLTIDNASSSATAASATTANAAATTTTDAGQEETVYKIEVPANRYDLLCIEGLVQALLIFQSKQQQPEYQFISPPPASAKQHFSTPLSITQSPATHAVRRYVVAAALYDLEFTPQRYASCIDLQDKLHQNIGRKRTLVAIGTHDLDQIAPGPITYDAQPFDAIKFQPLNEQREFTVTELYTYYKSKSNCHLSPYLSICEHSPVHPVLRDSQGNVLSLPPLINGDRTKLSCATRNLLIECTGTDLTKCKIVLNTLIAAFSQYCRTRYSCTPIQVTDAHSGGGLGIVSYPDLRQEVFLTSRSYLNRGIGVQLSSATICELLRKMSLHATVLPSTSIAASSASTADDEQLQVRVPITRSDILHAVDIMEDVAIAYGYNRIVKTLPQRATIARPSRINKWADTWRDLCAQCGYSEVLTWALVSHNDCFASMNHPVAPVAAAATAADAKHSQQQSQQSQQSQDCVRISNPKTSEFEIVRTQLIPGLLKALSSNKGLVSLPIRLFEVSDVVHLSHTSETGAQNERHIAALYCDSGASGFSSIHGLLDRIMMQNGYFASAWLSEERAKREKRNAAAAKRLATIAKSSAAADAEEQSLAEDLSDLQIAEDRIYSIVASANNTFLPGRCAEVRVQSRTIGTFGILHPNVLKAFELPYPCSALELNAEFFLDEEIKRQQQAPVVVGAQSSPMQSATDSIKSVAQKLVAAVQSAVSAKS